MSSSPSHRGAEPYAARIRAEQIDLLYEQAPVTLIASVLVAVFLGVVHRDIVPIGHYLPWLLVTVLVAVARMVQVRVYRVRRAETTDPERWRLPYNVGAVANGALWGIGGLLLFSPEHPAYQSVLLVTLAAVIAGGVVALSSVRETPYCFIVPIVALLGTRMLMEGSEVYLWLAAAALIYGAFMLRLAHRGYDIVARSLRLRFTNDDLLDELQRANDNAEVLNRELAGARDEALRALQAKSDFLATMSHEIRTPMNGVLGLTELLQATKLDETQRRYAQNIERAGETLLTIINDILDLSRIEAGRLHIDDTAFAPAAIVREVSEMLGESARGKNLVLTPIIAPELTTRQFRGDPGRLRQILLNLIGNAIKFTTAGGSVVARLTCEAVSDSGTTLRFEIADTGIGIKQDAREQIFEPFLQADNSTTRQYGGTGLGLAICKRLVDAMGGDIGVASEPGGGSCFWFTLCLARADDTDAIPASRPVGGQTGAREALGLKVLVAEDNPINQEIALSMLRALGCEGEVVADGEAALAALADGVYDAVLMDCQMPVLDGLEATRRWRQREPQTEHHVPIIALTADALPGDRERCLAAGMDDYLSKPFKLQQLEQLLVQWVPAPAES